VHVRTGPLTLSEGNASSLLLEARHTTDISFRAQSVRVGDLRLGPTTLDKRGAQLVAQALVSEHAVRAALPAGVSVQLLGSERGRVEVAVQGSLFGVDASMNAVAYASEGKLLVKPTGLLLGALQLTLFADPHVYVQAVGARALGSEPPSYRLSLSASLR